MNNKIYNFYELIDKKYLTQTNNPNYNIHKMKIPFRCLIVGSSGSMKTNTLLNIIKKFDNTFNKIVIITKNKDEPLYRWLESKIPENLYIGEGIESIPNMDEFNVNENSLIVFDDLMMEKNLKYVAEYFIRCRKLNISAIFISQSYFIQNNDFKTIRRNCNYLIIKKINSTKDINLIIKEYSLDINKEQFYKLYNDIIKDNKTNFLMIDIDESPENRFRCCFDTLNIDSIMIK